MIVFLGVVGAIFLVGAVIGIFYMAGNRGRKADIRNQEAAAEGRNPNVPHQPARAEGRGDL